MAHPATIFLNLLELTPKKTASILNTFKNLDQILQLKALEFKKAHLINDKDVEGIRQLKNSKVFESELELIKKFKIETIDLFDKAYPELLKEISHPPLVLYLKGDRNLLKEYCLSIVGTRLATLYGLSMAEKFSKELAGLSLVIVSGLARGIDTKVHQTALKYGKTIAVLGSGLLNIYPKENQILARQITSSGALISEFPLRTPPAKENFPRRNRIISGLSKGTLVIEAALRSGALITAGFALEQNREVFALPGKASSPLSYGTHGLIKAGAKLVDSVNDILDELNLKLIPVPDR